MGRTLFAVTAWRRGVLAGVLSCVAAGVLGPFAAVPAMAADGPGEVAPPVPAAAAASPLPAAWWRLDEAVPGATVPDASGNGHVLSLLNGPGWYTDTSVTPSRTSLRLDRDRSQWGSTSGPLVDTAKQFSWSAWVGRI